ncbi:MAG: deoxyribonuclease V [Chloroflexota bacterium]|nr:deoxyribonuclease V [Chloroflexota bacterium]
MLTPVRHHPWDVSPKEAIAIQEELAAHIDTSDALEGCESVAGIDVGLEGEVVQAAVVVLTFPDLKIVERVRAERPLTFPYIPGLLTFREAPVILDALARLEREPDVLIFDGQGYAHPRHMGLATHVGVLLDYPTVGCAKSRLCGTHEEPGPWRGQYTWLRDGGEIIGAVVRTRTNVNPVFISIGHKISLQRAVDLVFRCGGGYKLPEPTRWAHRVVSGTA